MHVIIDAETYYCTEDQISVSTQGLRNYARDSYMYIFSVVAFEDPVKFLATGIADYQWVGLTEDFEKQDVPFDLETAQPWAANSNFDQAWWEKYFPAFKKPWLCVLDLGRHYQLPNDLARLSQAVLEAKVVDKKLRGDMDGVHWRDLTPEKQTEMLQYCLNDSIVEARTMATLITAGIPDGQKGPKIMGMSPIEYDVAMYTRMTSRRGIAINVALVESDIQLLETTRFNAIKGIPWGQDLQKNGKPVPLLSMPRLHVWCAKNNIPAPESRAKGDEELEELMSDHPLLRQVIDDMRTVNVCDQLIAKARQVLARTDENGEMPLELIYCGAPHTRRWSSRGVNIQNLHKFPIPLTAEEKVQWEQAKTLYGDEAWKYFTGGVWPRRWLVPRKGKKFVILDYVQIEPRCLAWLTGDEAMLSAVRAGYNLYEAHARATMGYVEPTPLKKTDPKMYGSAKIRVLALGYGLGWLKYLLKAKEGGFYPVIVKEAEEMLATGNYIHSETDKLLTLEELIEYIARRNVQEFRRQSTLTTDMWKILDESLETALRMPGSHNLDIEMPTGENLRHWFCRRIPRIEVVIGEDGKEIKKTKYSWMTLSVKNDTSSASYRVWGGFLTENVVQRMARDVIAPKVLELEAAGIPVLFSSHDEIIAEVDEDIAEQELERAKVIMKVSPPWAPDLPLEVEGGIHIHYVK
jgi:hypothetical protein